jgi:hypothetical protein
MKPDSVMASSASRGVGPIPANTARSGAKVFCALFFKKALLSCFLKHA